MESRKEGHALAEPSYCAPSTYGASPHVPAGGSFFETDGKPYSDDRIVIARSGHSIDTSTTTWRIGVDHQINVAAFAYEPTLFEGVGEFLRNQIRRNSPAYVAAQCGHLKHLGRRDVQNAVTRSIRENGFFDMSVVEAFRGSVAQNVDTANRPNYLAAFVRFYLFCVDVGMPGFDDDVAAELDAIVVGSNPHGVAVMSHDPDQGPIPPDEMASFLAKLRDATEKRTLPTSHLLLTWLLVCFGLNSKSVRLLHETDFVVTPIVGADPVIEIRIPRIKKRTSGERDQFRVREIEPVVHQLAADLIAENSVFDASGFDRPLFRRSNGRSALIGTDMASEAYRVDPAWPGQVLTEVAEVLDLCNRSGDRLHLTPRRLRYTFGTRLVTEGVSPQELADALDHSSTAHVMIYFNARLSAVKRIDETIGPGLAPVAAAFLGRIVVDENEVAADGVRPPRISHVSPTMQSMRPLGSCGEQGDCTLAAPIACYLCRDFAAWAEADHRLVLATLVERRDRELSRGADPKWTQIHDATIDAVKEVIRRCDAINTQDI